MMGDEALERHFIAASQACDQYVRRRVVGQDIPASDPDRDEKYRRGMELSTLHTLQYMTSGGITSPVYWYKLGEKAFHQPELDGIWCDHSAGLAVFLLCRRQRFDLPLNVIAQGDPRQSGHWWVLVGWDGTSPLSYDMRLDTAFTVDIWGGIRAEEGRATFGPAQVIYNCDPESGDPANSPRNRLQSVCRIDPSEMRPARIKFD